MEVTIHVKANDAKVIRARDIGDNTLSPFPLFWHPHPHVPIPELRDDNKTDETGKD